MDKVDIGLLCTIGGFIVGCLTLYFTQKRNTKKESKDEGESRGVMLSDIGYIKAGVDDLKASQKEQAAAVGMLTERVTRVEESAKQAHKRIDESKGEQS